MQQAKPKNPWNPERLDARAFAQAGAILEAKEPLERFPRLQEETCRDAAEGDSGSATLVAWQARGELRAAGAATEPSVWLHLQAQVTLPLTCQRCLGPVDTPLAVDRWFRFVADEASAAAQDEDSEEDVLALEPRPSLLELLEDELLMELPLVPMHEACPVLPAALGTGQATDAIEDAGEPARPNPFAGLAKLKK